MESHALTHSGQKPHRCNFEDCGFASARESSLKNHLLRHLDRNKPSSRPVESRASKPVSISEHSCKVCEFKTRKLQKYDAHVQSHREKGHLICLICDFVTLKQKRFENHIKNHELNTGYEYISSKRNNVTPETDKSQNGSCNKHSLLTQETLKAVTKSGTVTQPAESATEKDSPKHKKLKVNHHFNNNPKLKQDSKKHTKIQPSPQLEKLTTKTYLNRSPSTKGSFRNLATGKDSCFENSEGISQTNVGPSLENIDSAHSVLQVKVKPCKKYSCPVCDFGTKKKTKYKDHVEFHQKEGYLFCSLCDFVSRNEKLFKKHLRSHKNNLLANISNVQLTNEDTLQNLNVPPLPLNSLSVTRSDSDETAFEESAAVQISECDSKLLKMKEIGTLGGKKCLCCSVCDYKTNHKSHFTEHTRIHTGDRPFPCTYSGCSYSSAKKCNLKTHMMLRHSKEKPYSCQLCGERFQNKPLLNLHVRNHKGKKRICCRYKDCEFSCASSSDLKIHIRTHTLEKPHHCDFEGCQYSCSRKFALKAHIRTHTRDKLYRCTFKNCNYSTIDSSNLKTHTFTHTMVPPFNCDFSDCEFSCAQSVYFKLHIMQHLTQSQNRHSCPKCKFRSRTLLEIEQHVETHHKLQNASSKSGDSEPVPPMLIGENAAAEDVTHVLRVQTQASLGSQNNNKRNSETRDQARPSKKYLSARCDFESKSKKKYISHLDSDSHQQNSADATREVSFTSTSQTELLSENCLQIRKTAEVSKKSAKKTKSPDNATKINLLKHKTMKTKNHFEKHPEIWQISSSNAEMQSRLLLKPHATKSSVNFSRNKSPHLAKPGTQKEEESSAGVDVTETNSPTNAQPCVVNNDLPQSVSQVKTNLWRKYCCPNCEFDTRKKRKYKDHVGLYQEEGYLFCSLCDFSVLNSIRFKKHLRTHENDPCDDNNSEIQRSSCPNVPPMRQQTLSDTTSTFLNSYSLSLGDEVSFDESVGAMQLPDYRTKLPRLKEKETSNEQNCFKCYLCDYQTQHKHHLTDHARIHTGDRPFSCTYSGCNYSATQKRSITVHFRVHTKVKPYHCDFNDCKFSCAQPGHLKAHMQRHLTQNPHSCPKCKFRSRTSLEIEQHLETHHKLQDASNSSMLQPNAPIRESPAESITNILGVQAQPSFSTQNNNEKDFETRDVARPRKKYVCAPCDFESKSHKKYKAHLESHVEETQLLKTRDTKLAKHKTNSKQGIDISSAPSQRKENSTALLRETKMSLAAFPCNFCKKSFAIEMKLFNHLRYHTGQKTPGL